MRTFILILLILIAVLYVTSNILEGVDLILQHKIIKLQKQLTSTLSNTPRETGFCDCRTKPPSAAEKEDEPNVQ